MKEEREELDETTVSLKDVVEEGTLPGQPIKRGGRRKKLLMAAALSTLVLLTIIGGYFLLRGKDVQVKANRRAAERVTSGADLQKAAYDSLRGSLTEPVNGASAIVPATNAGAGQESAISMIGITPSPSPSNTSNETFKASAPIQSGIAMTIAPPVEIASTRQTERDRQQDSATAARQEAPQSRSASASSVFAKPNVGASITFTNPAASKQVVTAQPAITTASRPATTGRSAEDVVERPELKRARALPSFGAMLPVRSMGVLYTLRAGSLARFELARDIRAGNWALKRGTVFVGAVLGADADRAYVQIKGFVDPATNGFVRLEGEALGSDGGAGLRGKRRRISPAWIKVLDRAAQSGTQILTGVLGRRDSSVIVATDPYGTYRSGVGYDQSQLQSNRTFVEVAAGSVGFVLVTTLPEPSKADAHLAIAGLSRNDAQGDVPEAELAELLAEADAEKIRAALPRMSPELRRVAERVLKEIDATDK